MIYIEAVYTWRLIVHDVYKAGLVHGSGYAQMAACGQAVGAIVKDRGGLSHRLLFGCYLPSPAKGSYGRFALLIRIFS